MFQKSQFIMCTQSLSPPSLLSYKLMIYQECCTMYLFGIIYAQESGLASIRVSLTFGTY